MRRFSRRRLIISGAILAGAGGIVLLARQSEPPTVDWVRERLWGDDLKAYSVWDGVPRAAVEVWPGRLSYDLLIPGDWFWPNWPPAPQWQLAGLGYAIAASTAPATAGYAPCVGYVGEDCGWTPELFGQINDPEIVAMDVRIGDAWRRFPVAAPGFVVRLDGAAGPPAGLRWFAADGRLVWELPGPSPTSPGAPASRRRKRRGRNRGRRHATPAPAARDQPPPRLVPYTSPLDSPVSPS